PLAPDTLARGGGGSPIERVRAVREAAERTGQVVAVLADLPGPKVRAASFPAGVTVPAAGTMGRRVPADAERTASSRDEFCVEYPTLLHDLERGDKVVVGDGAISLAVQYGAPDARPGQGPRG